MSIEEGLKIDIGAELGKIREFVKDQVLRRLRRKGAVVGLSGGIDSAVTAAVCVEALGKERVLGLLLPERESNPVSLDYGRKQAKALGIETELVDLTPIMDSLGVYEKRNEAIREAVPGFGDDWKFNVSLPQDLLERDRINYYSLVAVDPAGRETKKRLSAEQWQRISSYQNMKQRVRMIMLYHFAERKNYAVVGTTNRSETLQGFFVKFGDGGVDIEPLAHLYKVQVYQLADRLPIVEEIRNRPPSPDTYSLPVTDKEFYFCLEYDLLDRLLYAYENSIPPDSAAAELGLREDQVKRVFRDLEMKERASWHLRCTPPNLLGEG